VVLGVVGVVIWIITYFARAGLHVILSQVIYNGVVYILSAIIGAAVALLIFLAVLLKT